MMKPMKPKFILLNWSRGCIFGLAEDEAAIREKLEKCANNAENACDTFLIAEVKAVSSIQRVEE